MPAPEPLNRTSLRKQLLTINSPDCPFQACPNDIDQGTRSNAATPASEIHPLGHRRLRHDRQRGAGRERRQAQDRLCRRHQRPGRRLGHLERPLDADARRLAERERRRQDRRRHLQHRRSSPSTIRRIPSARSPAWRRWRRRASTTSSARTSTTAPPPSARSPKQNGIIYFPYAFPKALYTKPASNAVLGMIANYQSGPAIYKYLKENKGVKTVAFVAANESDPLSQRDGGVAAAKALGLDGRRRRRTPTRTTPATSRPC